VKGTWVCLKEGDFAKELPSRALFQKREQGLRGGKLNIVSEKSARLGRDRGRTQEMQGMNSSNEGNPVTIDGQKLHEGKESHTKTLGGNKEGTRRARGVSSACPSIQKGLVSETHSREDG